MWCKKVHGDFHVFFCIKHVKVHGNFHVLFCTTHVKVHSLRTGSRLDLGRDSRVGAGRAESGLVRRECSGEPVDIPLKPLFHDTSSWYQDLIG